MVRREEAVELRDVGWEVKISAVRRQFQTNNPGMTPMKRISLLAIALSLLLAPLAPAQHHDYPLTQVPFDKVKVDGGFWGKRIEVNRAVTLSHNFRECEETGRIDNFAIAGGLKQGKFVGIHFNDSDVYKAMEAAAYHLAIHHDPQLEKYLDSLIAIIAAAQESDGYLYTARKLIRDDYQPPGGKDRWVGIKDGSHELYNVGHMYEAAVAHFKATGKRNFLTIAIKNANLLCDTFGPGKRGEVPGHQEIEIGLVKLYRVTGEEKYLNLARFYLDERGNPKGHELMGEYNQDHKPVREQTTAVGHSVRAAYMYAGMADVAALTGDSSFVTALDKIWDDVVSTKLYITGGLGASGGNEGFSSGYELPNLTAYCETCAAIANALWNDRMFLWHGDGKYFDVIERAIYNNVLSGIGMTGDCFFYPNRLEVLATGAKRSPWFDCACCPPNDARFIPSIQGWIYAYDDKGIYVNLFVGSETTVPMAAHPVPIKQVTGYPWEGKVQLTLKPDKPASFALNIRIPGWAQGRPVPSDLYQYLDKSGRKIRISVNGKPVEYTLEKNYAGIQRTWKKGDEVEVDLPMEVRRVVAHPNLKEDNGRVALERGPIVYCLEGIDNKDGKVVSLVVPDNAKFTTEYRRDLLGGVQVIKGSALPARRNLAGEVETGDTQEITAIPYYAWAHRDRSEMTVWPAREKEYARWLPSQTLAYLSKATASRGRNLELIKYQTKPANSNDQSCPFVSWWPQKGTTEWVQYDFPKEATVSKAEVYWFDDTGFGECRVPASWRVLYKDGADWKPVENTAPYEVHKDQMNGISFKPVRTTALRLEVGLVPDFSTGLYTWNVE
jgi:uncharacterized protein